MKLKDSLFLATSLLCLSPLATAGVDSLMEQCNACHGDKGVSQWTDVPTIAGLAEFVHADALYAYKESARPCADSKYRQGDTSRPATNMCAIAKSLDDDTIDAIAAAYAVLPYVRAKQDFDESLAVAGKAVHEAHCDRCHSDGGTDPDDEAGMLGGQMTGYLKTAFAEFNSGERDQPSKMKEAMDSLSDADAKALLNYYASIQ